jgi:hypothetical protein
MLPHKGHRTQAHAVVRRAAHATRNQRVRSWIILSLLYRGVRLVRVAAPTGHHVVSRAALTAAVHHLVRHIRTHVILTICQLAQFIVHSRCASFDHRVLDHDQEVLLLAGRAGRQHDLVLL